MTRASPCSAIALISSSRRSTTASSRESRSVCLLRLRISRVGTLLCSLASNVSFDSSPTSLLNPGNGGVKFG